MLQLATIFSEFPTSLKILSHIYHYLALFINIINNNTAVKVE